MSGVCFIHKTTIKESKKKFLSCLAVCVHYEHGYADIKKKPTAAPCFSLPTAPFRNDQNNNELIHNTLNKTELSAVPHALYKEEQPKGDSVKTVRKK